MKPNELSELFNFSERKKYDIFSRSESVRRATEEELRTLCNRGTIVLVSDDYDNTDKFPTVDVAALCGYKVEDGNREFIVRKLTDLSNSVVVKDAIQISDCYRPVVLYTNDSVPPFTCNVIGCDVSCNKLYVNIIYKESAGIVCLQLENCHTIKKDL